MNRSLVPDYRLHPYYFGLINIAAIAADAEQQDSMTTIR